MLCVVVVRGMARLVPGGRSAAVVGGTAGARLAAHPGAAGRRVEGGDGEGIGPVRTHVIR